MGVYRIDLAYDGTGFRGWARNAGVRTVQEELETALQRIIGTPVTLTVAGRTDAGVHARHQVASFAHASEVDCEAVARSLRGMLGPEISVQSVAAAPEGFDARFSALRRSYRYFIDEATAPDPLRARWVWHRGESFDVDAMNRAAEAFVGKHDFASLCRAVEGGGTERTVESATWWREAGRLELSAQSSELLVFATSARAFCHQMVRSMVALCVEVGRGKLEAAAIPEILAARDRNASRGVAPAHGLTLWDVEYEL